MLLSVPAEHLLEDMTDELLETQSWLGGKMWWCSTVFFWLVVQPLCSISNRGGSSRVLLVCTRGLHGLLLSSGEVTDPSVAVQMSLKCPKQKLSDACGISESDHEPSLMCPFLLPKHPATHLLRLQRFVTLHVTCRQELGPAVTYKYCVAHSHHVHRRGDSLVSHLLPSSYWWKEGPSRAADEPACCTQCT